MTAVIDRPVRRPVTPVPAPRSADRPADRSTVVSQPARPRFDNSVGLSERECAIVARIARGMSNEDIGRELYLSVNTIKSYIRSAYRRMDVETRTQAVVWAFDHALVTPLHARVA